MPIPGTRFVRRILLSRLVRNLAVALGLFQALIAHWIWSVALARASAGLAVWLGVALVLALANAAIVPSLQRSRRAGGGSRVSRIYVESGVATLIVGLSVIASWVAYALLGGAALALGAPAATVFDVFRVASALLVASVAAQAAWGFTIGQRRIEVTTTRVLLPKLHAELTGLRIAQISD